MSPTLILTGLGEKALSVALGVYVTMKGSLLNVIKSSAFPEKGIEPDGIKEFL